jgi:hypothetical protein
MSWHTSGMGVCPGIASSSPASSWPAKASLWARGWQGPWKENGRSLSRRPPCGMSAGRGLQPGKACSEPALGALVGIGWPSGQNGMGHQESQMTEPTIC